MNAKSPFRLTYIGEGMGTITRVDDPNFSERVYGATREACHDAVKKRHHQWHRDREIAQLPCPLLRFIAANCKAARGHRVTLAEFYKRFTDSLLAAGLPKWGKHSIRKRLPIQFPCGPGTGNATCIGNLSFDMSARPKLQRYQLVDGRLKLGRRRT